MSCDSKELFVQKKHVEAWNERIDTPANFTVLWKDRQKQPPEVFC